MKITKSEYQGVINTEELVELTEEQLYICKKYNIDFDDVLKLFSSSSIPKELFKIESIKGREKDVWNLCEKILGRLGKIKEDKYVFIDGKFMYTYNSKYQFFWLSYDNILSFFKSEFNMEYIDIQHVTSLYIEDTYNLKGIQTKHSSLSF
jgi:hypothetical protein